MRTRPVKEGRDETRGGLSKGPVRALAPQGFTGGAA